MTRSRAFLAALVLWGTPALGSETQATGSGDAKTGAPSVRSDAAGGASGTPRPPLGHNESTYTFGVGAFVPSYTPPAPGTYELPPIDSIADHRLVDAAGHATTLSDVIGDRYAVVSFIYGNCAEASGCPMSTAVLHHLDQRLAADTRSGNDVALVTISFDPLRDGPERLAQMEKQRAARSTWQFVTTRDESSLSPLLEDFGQTISKLNYADGTWTGVYRHVLKVFLLDRQRRVRNVYSVGFLDPTLVANDLETLKISDRR